MSNKILSTLLAIFSYGNNNQLDIRKVRYLPRWLVLVLDLSIVFVSTLLTYGVVSELTSKFYPYFEAYERFIVILSVQLVFFLIFKTYAGLIRHSSSVDAIKLLFATGCAFGLIVICNYMFFSIMGEKIFLTVGLLLNAFISFTLLYTFRLFIKRLYEYFKTATNVQPAEKAFILGVNENSISITAGIDAEHPKRFDIVGFLSSNNATKRLRILNKPVIQYSDSFISKIKAARARALILPEDGLSFEKRFKIVEECLNNNIKVYKTPQLSNWVEGKPISNAVKSIQIEDLLNRKPIELDKANIRMRIEGMVILVTGGAGSIGSEIIRQVASYNPKRIIALDHAETPLHNLSLELGLSHPDIDFVFQLADVRDKNSLEEIFKKETIDYVYHAAAYKHVPLIEQFPKEGVQTNILGTINLTELSLAYNVRHFVFVSTDKAVNPTNVMGASKRAAEMYVQSRNFIKSENEKTKFITTRFGNVLGSNGSVVPLFKKQIENGGPITITHPEIIRYFMTISEACQLVLEAGAMGNGGEIFVFDMGAPVKIKDLAFRMIQLAGYIPEQDIQIAYTGLRPGEKLYEELLSDNSITLRTHHEKIMISTDQTIEFDSVQNHIAVLQREVTLGSEMAIVKELKTMIPNFKSNNSTFEALDMVKDVSS